MRYTRLTAAHDSAYSRGSVHAYLLHGEVPTLVDAPTRDAAFLDELERGDCVPPATGRSRRSS